MTTRVRAAWLAAILCVSPGVQLGARDGWIEVKSANFTVVSNASERSTRALVWQLEQVRSVTKALNAWARVDLNKPLSVILVKDEGAMRDMAPEFWEKRGGTRPASVWVSGADRHHLTIRADIDVETQGQVNPHISAYFSYINLIMMQSLSPDLPMWLSRGLTGVLSNALVRNDHIVIGAPIPWYIERLGERRLPLARLLTVTRDASELRDAENSEQFDAQAWAFVHFLMFGNKGAHADKLNAFARLVSGGQDPSVAFRDTLGAPEQLDHPVRVHFEQPVYAAHRYNLDAAVQRERFPVRPLAPAESAAVRGRFHVAMGRPVEARAAIADARKADPGAPGSYEAEGLLLDREDKKPEARAVLAKAVESGSTDGYVYYRLASLTWRPEADTETLGAIEAYLARASALNNRDAHAYSWLGEIRSLLRIGEPVGLVMRAVGLDPREATHRLRAAYVLGRAQRYDEAEAQLKVATSLVRTEAERQRIAEMLQRIGRMRAAGAPKEPS